MAPLLILLKLGLVSLFWGLMFFLGKHATLHLSPESISGWRFLLAGLLLAPWLLRRQRVNWAGLRRNAMPLLVMAVVGIGGFNIALFHGMRHTGALNGALIMALCPALIAALGTILCSERLDGRQQAGLGLGIAGVLFVVSGGSLDALRALHFQRGDVYVLLAACCWALYSTLPKRFIDGGLDSAQLATSTVCLAGLLLPLYAQATQGDFLVLPPPSVIVAVAAMGLFGSGIAYIWWNDSIRTIGASKAAVFMNLVPIFTAGIGVAMGQEVTAVHVVGAALVLGSVWLTTAERKAGTTAEKFPRLEIA